MEYNNILSFEPIHGSKRFNVFRDDDILATVDSYSEAVKRFPNDKIEANFARKAK